MNVKRAKKKHKAQPIKGDRVLRFLRERWMGVTIVMLLTTGGAWLTWHIQDCLKYQKSQLATVRRAWTNARMHYQKETANREVLATRMELLKQAVMNRESQTK
jgi:hypothetical protein